MFNAMHYLIGPGGIEYRLEMAWLHITDYYLADNPNDPEFTLPPWLADGFQELASSWEQACGYKERVAQMSSDECVDEARRIFDWHGRYVGETHEHGSEESRVGSELKRAGAIVPGVADTRHRYRGRRQ